MKIGLCLCLMFSFASLAFCHDCAEKPEALKTKEEYCWTEEVELADRIVQRSRNVLNFAKKKLGIGVVDENDEPQKCEYYMCILRQLHLLNSNDYPAYEHIKEWAKNNVIYSQAVEFVEQVDKCNEALTDSTVREVNFYADQIDQTGDDETSTSKEQTTCEIAAEFIKCLSRQKKCSVFQYP